MLSLNARGFNTQPPEGGWLFGICAYNCLLLFQHTAARRRLAEKHRPKTDPEKVSTHSRPKAAGIKFAVVVRKPCSFNTQPPEGGWVSDDVLYKALDGFNTQPPEGGCEESRHSLILSLFQHTAARRRLGDGVYKVSTTEKFQHTAARRRLAPFGVVRLRLCRFQHTAARRRLGSETSSDDFGRLFQHTAARRRLVGKTNLGVRRMLVSTHSRPKAAGIY